MQQSPKKFNTSHIEICTMFYIERKIAMIRNPYNPIPHDSNDKESIQSNTTRYSRHHKEMWQQHKLAKLDSKVCMMAKNEEIILHLAFLLFQLYIGLNEIKPVIMVLDHQRQLPACSPHRLIRAFVTIHLFDSISKLAAIEILSSS